MDPEQSLLARATMGDEEPWLTIDLEETGDAGTHFHFRNEPGEEERENISSERPSSGLRAQAFLLDVIHGRMGPGREPASLLVFEFRFLRSVSDQRFRQVEVEVRFADTQGRRFRDPEVTEIAPKGEFILIQTTRTAQYVCGAHAGGQIGAAFGGVHGGFKWERTRAVSRADRAAMVGAIDLHGHASGPMNVASFALYENAGYQDGIPPVLKTAILLKRRSEGDRFHAFVKIKTKVYGRPSLGTMVKSIHNWGGSKVKDDPVLFNPARKPTRSDIDPENLGACKLSSLSQIDTDMFLPPYHIDR
jgi:hypothetical protein